MDALFVAEGDLLVPTELTRGPWRPDAQHGGPPSALLGRAVEQVAAGIGGQVARIGVELVRPVPLVPLEVTAANESISRRVSHVEVTMRATGAVVALARALVLHVAPLDPVDGDVGGLDLPGPEAAAAAPNWVIDEGVTVYHRDAVEHRFASGGFTEPGPAVDWVRLRVPLVAGEPTSGWCRALAVADFGSGVSAIFDAGSDMGLINADLTVALHRPPEGEWIRLEARSRLGPSGVGLCTTTLGDGGGAFGTATQSLMALTRSGAR